MGGSGLDAEAPLTREQAAKFVSCHVNLITKWVKSGLLPSMGRGRLLRVTRLDLLVVLKKLATPVVTEAPEAWAKSLLNEPKVRRIR